MSLALAMALGPAISPTNSNGNFDPSFLPQLSHPEPVLVLVFVFVLVLVLETSSKKPPPKTSHRSRPRPRPRPRSSPPASRRTVFRCVFSSSCRVHPPSCPCFPPCLSSSSLRSSGRPRLPFHRARGLAPGKSPVNGTRQRACNGSLKRRDRGPDQPSPVYNV